MIHDKGMLTSIWLKQNSQHLTIIVPYSDFKHRIAKHVLTLFTHHCLLFIDSQFLEPTDTTRNHYLLYIMYLIHAIGS